MGTSAICSDVFKPTDTMA